MSEYFSGVGKSAGKPHTRTLFDLLPPEITAPLKQIDKVVANVEAKNPGPPPPARVVKVRAHSRTLEPKPPGAEHAAKLAAINTQSVRPTPVYSTAQRFAPHYKDEPIAGFTHGIKNLDGTWNEPGGARAQPGAYLAERPYYTDKYTTSHNKGPSGDPSTGWNAAQVAKAKKIQIANYGTPGYIVRSLIPGGTNEVAPSSVTQSLTRAANAATFVLPGGGVGEAAGIIGFGLKALKNARGARAFKDVAEAAPKVPIRTTTIKAPPATHLEATARWNRFLDLMNKDTPLGPSEHAELAKLRAQFTVPMTPAEQAAEAARLKPPSGSSPAVPAAKAVPTQWAGKKPGDKFTYRGPNGTGQGYIDAAGKPRNEKGEELFGHGNPYPVEGLKSEVKAKLAGGEYEYTGPVSKAPDTIPEVAPASKPPVEGVVEPLPAVTVRRALPGAKILRGKQEAGYSLERGRRVAAARVHLENPNLTPAERVGKAKGELAGELPKINFQGFSELNEQSLAALQTHILDHPHLMPFQKIRASDALVNALAGKVPTRGEIVLLEHVFGKDTAAALGSISKNPIRDKLLNALNVPRSLMASFDLSAPFRQGLMVSTRHPKIFAQNFGPMIRAFGSEKVYHATIADIRARPTYPLMIEAKLPLTELGGDVGSREEQFASQYAERLTGGKYSPVRASGRAYTGFLDKTRADVFDHLIQRAQAQGINVQDPKFLQSLGRYIGSATGRGDLGAFQEAGKVLNAVLFSPRLLASRLNFLNPAYYARLDPFARKEALRSALQLAGTMSTLLALASRVPGVKVGVDPRSADWGKIRIGNTRLDIAGGFQQELRLLAQLASGTIISSTTGKKMSLTAGGFGQPTRLDIAQRFFMGKESPIASLVTDWARGSTQIGQPFSWRSAATQRMIPLLAQDSYDLYKEKHGGVNGLAAAFAGYGIGVFGIGTQTYGPAKPKTTKPPIDYFGGANTGGGSPYFSSPSQSGDGGYFGR